MNKGRTKEKVDKAGVGFVHKLFPAACKACKVMLGRKTHRQTHFTHKHMLRRLWEPQPLTFTLENKSPSFHWVSWQMSTLEMQPCPASHQDDRKQEMGYAGVCWMEGW